MSKAGERILKSLKEAAAMDPRIVEFVAESNRIEGILSVKQSEVEATENFLALKMLELADVCDVQEAYAPNMPIRFQAGMNVRVGRYVAPEGGPQIITELEDIIGNLNNANKVRGYNPWKMHVAFERLHPFMDGNGRTGRVLWAWHMQKVGLDPFALTFLHRFYYQTLENDPAR